MNTIMKTSMIIWFILSATIKDECTIFRCTLQTTSSEYADYTN